MNFSIIKSVILGNSIIRYFALIVSNNARKHALDFVIFRVSLKLQVEIIC